MVVNRIKFSCNLSGNCGCICSIFVLCMYFTLPMIYVVELTALNLCQREFWSICLWISSVIVLKKRLTSISSSIHVCVMWLAVMRTMMTKKARMKMMMMMMMSRLLIWDWSLSLKTSNGNLIEQWIIQDTWWSWVIIDAAFVVLVAVVRAILKPVNTYERWSSISWNWSTGGC